MKKAASLLPCLLWALIVLYPAGSLLAPYFGYVFRMSVLSTGAVLAVVTVLLDVIYKPTVENKVMGWLSATLTPLSLVNALFYVGAYPKMWMIVCVLVSIGCCCYLSLRHGRPLPLTVLSMVLSVIMLLPFVVGIFAALFPLGQDTVVQSVDSPNGTYTAQVVASSQGALGGDTLVRVCEENTIHCLLFTLEKKSQLVYVGEWGEFEDMRIYWKNEECLVINGAEYKIE